MKIALRKKNSKGFTFFELVLVLIILGIIAVSVIPTLDDMDDVGYQSVQEGTLGALRTAWAVAYSDAGNTDPTLAQIAPLVTGADTSATACTCTDSTNQIRCEEVFQADNTTTKAIFGVSGYECASTVATPNLIVILNS